MNFEQLTPKLKPLRFTGVKTLTRYEYDGVRIKVLNDGGSGNSGVNRDGGDYGNFGKTKDPELEEDSEEEKPPPNKES